MSPLFGRSAEPFIDPSRGDAEAAALRKAAGGGDWRTVEAALQASNEPLRREFLVDALAMHCEDLSWVDAWIAADPASANARLMWGACGVQKAWKVRTGKAPQHVASEQWKGFHDWLTNAEVQLRHATVMAPQDSAPWISLLWCAIGLEVPFEDGRDRWENLIRRNPDSELGAMAYATFTGPRWNGSAEMMWSFIHELLAKEAEGSPRWALVPQGHMEQWLSIRMRQDSPVHPSRYFDQPHVQQEINEAYSKYLGSPARRSSYLEPQHRELFAGCFYLMGARDALRRELEHIGPGIQQVPWAFLGSTFVAYKSVREAAGLK